MKIETWTSDGGLEEVHHFVEGELNIYLFGFNVQLLGEECYQRVRAIVQARLDGYLGRFPKE